MHVGKLLLIAGVHCQFASLFLFHSVAAVDTPPVEPEPPLPTTSPVPEPIVDPPPPPPPQESIIADNPASPPPVPREPPSGTGHNKSPPTTPATPPPGPEAAAPDSDRLRAQSNPPNVSKVGEANGGTSNASRSPGQWERPPGFNPAGNLTDSKIEDLKSNPSVENSQDSSSEERSSSMPLMAIVSIALFSLIGALGIVFLYKTLRKRNAASKHKSIDPHVPRVIVTEMIGVEPEQIDIVHSPHSAIIKTSTQYANQDILRQIIVTEGYATKPFKSEQDLETDHLDVVHDQWAISNSSSQLDNESFVNDPLFPDLMPPRDM